MLFMGTMMIGIFPSIEGILEAFGPMLENPFMQSLVGDVEQFNSLEGFLSVKVFAMMPVILAVYVVLAALGKPPAGAAPRSLETTEAGLDAARAAGASLVVTADCGTVARETVARARARSRSRRKRSTSLFASAGLI